MTHNNNTIQNEKTGPIAYKARASRFYGKMQHTYNYAKAIDDGKIIVGRKVSQAFDLVEMYLDLYDFDPIPVQRYIIFMEHEFVQDTGDGGSFELAMFQKFWIEVVYGFTHQVKTEMIDQSTGDPYYVTSRERVIREAPLVIARGNAKSTTAGMITVSTMVVDGEKGAHARVISRVKSQSTRLFESIKAMTAGAGTLFDKFSSLGMWRPTRSGLTFQPTPDNVSTLSVVSTHDILSLDGDLPYLVMFDEVHSYTKDSISTIRTGARKRHNSIVFYLTTSGTVRGAVYDSLYKTWSRILDGSVTNHSVFPLIYEIDSLEDVKYAQEGQPETAKFFQKANPMMGVLPTLSKENLIEEYFHARNLGLAAENEFLTKRLNFPTTAATSFFTNEEIMGNRHIYVENNTSEDEMFRGTPDNQINVIIGADFAKVRDISSISLMRLHEGKFYFKTFNFLPRVSLRFLPQGRRDFLLEQERLGNIILHERTENDIVELFMHVVNFMRENHIRPIMFTPDQHIAQSAVDKYHELYGKHFMSFYVSNTAKNLTSPMQSYKGKLADNKLVFDNDVTTWAHSNVEVEVVGEDFIRPKKASGEGHHTNKIDPFTAQLMAYAGFIQGRHKLQSQHWSGYSPQDIDKAFTYSEAEQLDKDYEQNGI